MAVRDGRGQIVAQSWYWTDRDGAVCFDNVEALGVSSRGDTLVALYAGAARTLYAQGVPSVTVGCGYTSFRTPWDYASPLRPVDYTGYRDSSRQWLLPREEL